MVSSIHATFLAMALFGSSGFFFDPCLALENLSEICDEEEPTFICGLLYWFLTSICDDEPEPENVNVTFKIVNNVGDASGCENKTLYYKCRWRIESGLEESTVTSVGPGGVSTLFISAYDRDGNGQADFVAYVCQVGNPNLDQLDGCVTGEGSAEDTLTEGETWTVTVNADGSIDEEFTPAGSRSGPSSAPAEVAQPAKPAAAAESKPRLQPVPDPRFAAEPSSAQGESKSKLQPNPGARVSPRR